MLVAAVNVLQAQQMLEAALLLKAKQLGVSPADYKGFIAREKAVNLNSGEKSKTPPYKGAYSRLLKTTAFQRTTNTSLCSNLDFEDQNYTTWSVFTASNTNSFLPPINVTVDPFPGRP